MQTAGTRISEIFSTREKSEHLVASKVRWDEHQRHRVALAQEERSQRSVQDDNDKGDLCWTEASEGIARRMVKFLEDSEAAKVSIRELEEQILPPNESRINVVRIARQARNEEGKMIQIFRQGESEVLIASEARWDEQLKGLIELERRCLTLREEVEHLSEGLEVLTDLMVSKKDMQKAAPEKHQEKIYEELKEQGEQKTKEALELVQRKH